MKPDRRIITLVLLLSFTGFVCLSWWLLFRDERALTAYGALYPHIDTTLQNTRQFLLKFGLNIVPTAIFLLLAITSFGAYFVSLKLSFSLKQSIVLAVVFQLIVFFSYPILSTDVFSYIFSERVSTQYQQNIWMVAPGTFTDDVFEPLADWKNQTSVYGALHQLTYFPISAMAGNNVILNVVLFKLVALIFSLGSIFVVVRLFQNGDQTHQSSMVRLIFWNPLFVLEFAGAGHNDIMMIFYALVSVYFWKNQKWLFAGVLLALAVQVKLIPIILFGFSCSYLLQHKKLLELVKYCAGFVSVTAVSFIYMQVTPWFFLQRVLYNSSVFWQSLPALTKQFFPGQNIPFTILFAVVVVLLVSMQYRNKWPPLYSTTLAFMAYLFFFSAAYWNWYALWLLAFVPFTNRPWLRNTILVYTMTSLLAYPMLWLSHRYGFGHPAWAIATYLAVVGIPVALLVVLRNRWKRTNLEELDLGL